MVVGSHLSDRQFAVAHVLLMSIQWIKVHRIYACRFVRVDPTHHGRPRHLQIKILLELSPTQKKLLRLIEYKMENPLKGCVAHMGLVCPSILLGPTNPWAHKMTAQLSTRPRTRPRVHVASHGSAACVRHATSTSRVLCD